jgi:hypothetical protein
MLLQFGYSIEQIVIDLLEPGLRKIANEIDKPYIRPEPSDELVKLFKNNMYSLIIERYKAMLRAGQDTGQFKF